MARAQWVPVVACAWGFCAFFPLGILYLNALLLLTVLASAPDLRVRLRRLRQRGVLIPILAVCAWTLVTLGFNPWFPDTASRLFHVFRVALVMAMGLMLSAREARLAMLGLMAGAAYALAVIIAHHAFGLPDWAIWSSLLTSRNNFSSGNMITLATSSGIALLFATDTGAARARRGWLVFALLTSAAVAFHAVSRNAQLLLLLLSLAVALFRFRSIKGVGFALAVAVLLGALVWKYSPTTQSRFDEMMANIHAVERDANYVSSVGVRLRMYGLVMRSMADHPLVGTGVGSWLPYWRVAAQELDRQQAPGEKQLSTINNPHNDFLLAGMETGLPGLLLLVWLVAYFVLAGWRRRSTPGGVLFVLGLSVFFTTLFNAPFRDAAFGMTLLWLMAASMALNEQA